MATAFLGWTKIIAPFVPNNGARPSPADQLSAFYLILSSLLLTFMGSTQVKEFGT